MSMENDMLVMKTKKRAMVLPSSKSPQLILPLSSLDLFKPNIQAKTVYFYNSNGSTNVLDFELLKEALAKTLALFYPFAGRLRRGENGRVEIICNDEGVPLVEVEADATIEDFGDFAPSLKLNQLLQHMDYTKDLSSRPMLHLQVTRFKCGGMSIGIRNHGCIGDALTILDFVNSWNRNFSCGRQRLGIPSGYVGNVTFLASVTLKAGQVVGDDISVLAREIKESFNVMTEEYLRSVIDFLELQIRKTRPVKEEEGEEEERKEGNAVSIFVMNNLLRLPYYDADFGWGKPCFVGPMRTLENVCTVMPSCPTSGDGSVFLTIELKEDHMTEFMKLFYDLVQ